MANNTDMDQMISDWADEYQRIFNPQISNDVAQLKAHLEKLEAIKKHLTAQMKLLDRMIDCNKAQIQEANIKEK